MSKINQTCTMPNLVPVDKPKPKPPVNANTPVVGPRPTNANAPAADKPKPPVNALNQPDSFAPPAAGRHKCPDPVSFFPAAGTCH